MLPVMDVLLTVDPPAPVECPIGGIYNFTQTGIKEFKYQTRIRGVTDRPRVGYQCDNVESEFKVRRRARNNIHQ